MKKIALLVGVAVVAVLVALTYFGFEYAVAHSITYIWDTLLDTETKRYLVVPLCMLLTMIFFATQHLLDRKSEGREEHGLGGGAIDARFSNLVTILFIGFISLVAGASLGPEAVLVPACMVVGAFVATKLFKADKQAVKALAAAGIIALFACFFHSFVIGFLAVFLVTKQAKVKLNFQLVFIAIIASATAYFTIITIDPSSHYFNWPGYDWTTRLTDVLIAIVLVIIGYFSTLLLKASHDLLEKIRTHEKLSAWWLQALIAGGGLSALYLLGGPLVQFTGNHSIAPMLSQATTLGALGLLWLYIVKLAAISWSKTMGYRGGLVFPMIFIASILAALATLIYADTNFMLALIGALIGILAAERKAKILF
jgi:H+/Cl- antiporter ClcA